MTALLSEIGPAWIWVIAGLSLGVGELILPGIFLIWIGLACLATGIVMAVVAPVWPLQALVFSVFAIAAVLLGRRFTRHTPSELNQRGYNLVGREFVLATPIVDGIGRLEQGDTSWRLSGPDLAAGSRVRVVGLDGVTLVVQMADTAA